MNRLLQLTSTLSPAQIKEVEDFAEFLSHRNARQNAETKPEYLDVSKLIGLCEGMGGDKPDKQLVREAWGDVARKILR